MEKTLNLKILSNLEVVIVTGGCINDPKGCNLCRVGAYDVSDFIDALNECERKYCNCPGG